MARCRPTPPSSLLFILLFLLSGAAFGQPPPPRQSRRLSSRSDFGALLSLRGSLGIRARDWPLKTDPCSSWAGVDCSASGRVVGLTVAGLHRTRLGKQNQQFAVDGLRNLTLLQSFNASGFSLPGAFPDWFNVPGAVPAGLARLDLSGASVSGGVPPALGALRNLSVVRLPGNQLDGAVPDALGSATGLTVLDLARNQLTGSVPASFSSLTSLTNLDLSSNRLSGPLPLGLGSLRSLQSLTLSGNFLNGTVPPSLLALPALRMLDLSANVFTGELPLNSTTPPAFGGPAGVLVLDLSDNTLYGELPPGAFRTVRRADLSGNYFQGVPPGGNVSVARNCFRGAANQRTEDDCAAFYAKRALVFEGFFPQSPAPAPVPVESGGRTRKKRNLRLVYILVPSLVGGAIPLLLFVGLLLVCLRRRGRRAAGGAGTPAGAAQSRRARKETANDSNAAAAAASRRGGRTVPAPAAPVNLAAVGDSYTYDQLLQATSGFGEANLIRRGHSGDLYHGTLESGTRVVVKRVDLGSGGGEGGPAVRKEAAYQVELDFFGRAEHERLVPLLGHCLAKDNEKLLVYKYMLHGDLASSLYRKGADDEDDSLKSLDWITRLKIALGIADALSYLHHVCTPPIVHRDIQASSILLDDKFEVRLGSLSEVCPQEGDGSHNVISRILRKSAEPSTSGSSPATCAYDVSCLGKVLLELVTGRLGISGSSDATANQMLEDILPHISVYDKEPLTKILDPSLILDEDFMEEVWAMAIVAKSCLNPKPSKRPLVKYVLKALENPLKVVREENITNSARMRGSGGASSRSWNAAVFGSWRSTSDIVASSGLPRDMAGLKRSETIDSRGSAGEHSFNHRKPPKEIFPEPAAGGSHDNIAD